MLRERQFGDLRSSRDSRRSQINASALSQKNFHTPKAEFDRSSQASSTTSVYVCVNCENLSMSAEKERSKRDRAALERSRYNQLQMSRRVYDEHVRQAQEKKNEEEKQKILDENRRMIEAHQHAKERERRALQREQQQESERKRQDQMRFEKQMAQRQHRVDDFRHSLEKQIEQKNQKKLRQQMEDRYQQPADNDDEKYLQLSRRKNDEYKEGLLKQIQEKEERRRKDRLNEEQQGRTAKALLDLAEQRANEMIAEQNRRRAQYQQQIRDLARSTEKKRKAELQQKEQERLQVELDREFDEKQYIQHEKVRQQRLNRYKNDLKEQVDQKQKQKWQEKLQDRYSTGFVNMSYQQIQKKLCDSCDKLYPKNYMTRYKRKKK